MISTRGYVTIHTRALHDVLLYDIHVRANPVISILHIEVEL